MAPDGRRATRSTRARRTASLLVRARARPRRAVGATASTSARVRGDPAAHGLAINPNGLRSTSPTSAAGELAAIDTGTRHARHRPADARSAACTARPAVAAGSRRSTSPRNATWSRWDAHRPHVLPLRRSRARSRPPRRDPAARVYVSLADACAPSSAPDGDTGSPPVLVRGRSTHAAHRARVPVPILRRATLREVRVLTHRAELEPLPRA